jgi:S-adenosylmethionine/arginine decarboxylase-like enzyme
MKKIWGFSTHINLYNCNHDKIRNINGTSEFLLKLTSYIKMTPYGLPTVIHFGKDPTVTGISANIFLEESNICLHLVEQDNSAFIDIFSCKKYSPEEAFDFCKFYFEAVGGTYSFLTRGI